MSLYKPPCLNQKYFPFHLNNICNFFCTIYENLTFIEDFNMIPDFCEINRFEHLILQPTCFIGLFSSAIDLILTNDKQGFMKSDTY